MTKSCQSRLSELGYQMLTSRPHCRQRLKPSVSAFRGVQAQDGILEAADKLPGREGRGMVAPTSVLEWCGDWD